MVVLLCGLAIRALADDKPVLCARKDRQTGHWKEGSSTRVRAHCLSSEVEVPPRDAVTATPRVIDANGTEVGVVVGSVDLTRPVPFTRDINGQTVALSATQFGIYGVNQSAQPDVLTVSYGTTNCSGEGYISASVDFYPTGQVLDGLLYYAAGEPRTVIVRAFERIYKGTGPSGCVSLGGAYGPQTMGPYATYDVAQFQPPFRVQ